MSFKRSASKKGKNKAPTESEIDSDLSEPSPNESPRSSPVVIPAPPPRSKPRRNPSPESRLNHYKKRLSTLNTLLPENLLVNSLRKHDCTAIHSRSKMTEISTPQQWLEAWSLYCSALTQYYPHIAPKLLKVKNSNHMHGSCMTRCSG